MALMPKRVKHRKVQRGSRKGIASAGQNISFGEYGLKGLDRGWVKGTQLEACRVGLEAAHQDLQVGIAIRREHRPGGRPEAGDRRAGATRQSQPTPGGVRNQQRLEDRPGVGGGDLDGKGSQPQLASLDVAHQDP